MSWIFTSGCKLHVHGTAPRLLFLLLVIASVTFLLQLIYLHSVEHQIITFWLPSNTYSFAGHRLAINNRLFQENLLNISEIRLPKFKVFKPYEAFGRETSIVRFREKTANVSYQFIVEENVKKYSLFRHPVKMVSSFNGNITIHQNNPGSFCDTSKDKIFLMSAFARNFIYLPKGGKKFNPPNPSDKTKEIVAVGWVAQELVNSTLNCCILLENNTIVSHLNEKRLVWMQVKIQPLMAVKFFCYVPNDIYGTKMKGVTISLPSENCLNKKFSAIEYMIKQPRDSLAVCAKIAYGTLSAQRLIEWLEIQKYIGVDQALVYYYNLNKEAMDVLLQYYREGFADLRPFDYPMSEVNKRYIGEKEAQPFIDEQVVLYEAMERLRGFHYVAVIDIDEILYARSTSKHNLKKFVQQLVSHDPYAAGFSLRTELFITDWQNNDDIDPEIRKFWHVRYQNRTRPLEDRVKSIVITDRVILGSIWTHNYTAKEGYKRANVPASLGTLKHYRSCRQNWHCYLRRGYRDQTVSNLIINIKDTLNARFSTLLVEYKYGASLNITNSRKKPSING